MASTLHRIASAKPPKENTVKPISPHPTLYHRVDSPDGMRVRLTLAERGLPWDGVRVDPAAAR